MRRIAYVLLFLAALGACGEPEQFAAPQLGPREKPEVVYARRVLKVHGHIFGELARDLKASGTITQEARALLTATLAPGALRADVEAGMNSVARRNFAKIKKNPGDIYFFVADAARPRPDCLVAVVYGDLGLLRRPNEESNATRNDMIRTMELRLTPLDPADDPLGVNTTEWQIAGARTFSDDDRMSCDGRGTTRGSG